MKTEEIVTPNQTASTPGPWTVEPVRRLSTRSFRIQDAQHIAACKEALAVMRGIERAHHDVFTRSAVDTRCAAAIAKAEGRQS